MKRITCEEFDDLISGGLVVVSSCTDLSGEFHSNPQIDTAWGLPDGTEVVRGRRYPSRVTGEPDRTPCEHWDVREPVQ